MVELYCEVTVGYDPRCGDGAAERPLGRLLRPRWAQPQATNSFSCRPSVSIMVINRLSVLVSGFGVGFGSVHTTLVVISGCFGTFQGRRLMIMVSIGSSIYMYIEQRGLREDGRAARGQAGSSSTSRSSTCGSVAAR